MTKINVLLLGSGAREHTLAWKINQSQLLNKLYIAPGNAGTLSLGENVKLNLSDFTEIGKFALKNDINMIVVGPEAPLVAGIYDFFTNDDNLKHIAVIGPSAKASQLEGSKVFAKDFMTKYDIPTAKYKSFSKNDFQSAKDFINNSDAPYVIKADGLAAGKGVVIVNTKDEAINVISDFLINEKFGNASTNIVIEEFLSGIELSVFVLTDGKNYVLLPEAKDYKQIGDNNTGPNTGGMGAVSPVPFFKNDFKEKVIKQIIEPTLKGINAEGLIYKGFIFFGLINCKGNPYVIEYNVRMGDPETQSVLPRLDADILDLFVKTNDGNLEATKVNFSEKHSATVVVSSAGYPDKYETGKEIKGLGNLKDKMIFHAGTLFKNETFLTNGGRVLSVTSLDKDIASAANTSYNTLKIISFEGMYFRKDIGKDLQ